jgi:hypothetical protein
MAPFKDLQKQRDMRELMRNRGAKNMVEKCNGGEKE